MSNRPFAYRLTAKARDDLDDIWRYTAESWSLSQADIYLAQLVMAFDGILAQPEMAREYVEFTPPVRILIHQGYVIVYRLEHAEIAIIRVLGGRQDWKQILSAIDR